MMAQQTRCAAPVGAAERACERLFTKPDRTRRHGSEGRARHGAPPWPRIRGASSIAREPFLRTTEFFLKPLAAATLAASMLAGCQQASSDHMGAARTAIAAQDPNAAIIHLRNAVAAEPGNGEARLLLGQQLLLLGEYEPAVVDLKRARELKIPDDRVVPVLAEAMLYARQTKLLIEQLGAVRLSTPEGNARLQTSLSQAYMLLDSLPRAKQAVEAALAAQPKSPEARLASARITLKDAGPAAALGAVDALLQDSPEFAPAWTYKGTIHAAANEIPKAQAAFDRALAIDPRQFHAMFSSVAMHIAARDLDKARTEHAKLMAMWPNSLYGRYLEARLMLLQGRHTEARPLFATLRNAMPENVPLLLASGVNELQLESPIQAEALLAQTVSLEPDSVPARYFLAQANLRLGRPERATQALSPLLESKSVTPEILVLAAQARLYTGDAQGASELYARAESFKSASPEVRTALAMSKVAKGEVDTALRELQTISESSADTDADLKLISTRLARNELNEALAALDKLDRKRPNQAATHELRGQVLLRRNETAPARLAFEAALKVDKAYVPAITQLTNLDVREGKAAEAEKRINDALAINANDSRLITTLAAMKARTGASSQEVLALIDRATRADPRDVNAWLMLMNRHYQAGDLQAALSAGRTATSMVPDNVQLLEMLGRAQLRAGDTRQAASTFANLVRVVPRSPSGYMGQAATLVATGEFDAADQVLQRLIEREPDSVDARRLAADVALRRKRFDAALAQAREVQRRRPALAAGWRLEGSVEAARGNPAAAVAAFRKGLDKGEAGDLPVRLHDTLAKSGKVAEADEFARSWLQTHPKDTELLSYLGLVQYEKKDWAAARSRFESVLAIDPNHVEALNNLASVLLEEKKPAEALQQVQRALALQPNRPEALDTLAQIYVKQQQPAKAIEALKLAINRSTDIAPLRLALAKVYIEAGDRQNAASELDALVALGRGSPTYAEARKLLAEQRRK
jgi:cellulose synthase operon protein C